MRKALFIFAIMLVGCGEAAGCPLQQADGGVDTDAGAPAWRCLGVFTYENENQNVSVVSDEPSEVYEVLDEEVPESAVLARVSFEGCVFTLVPGNGHGHADTSGRFDMEIPPWTADPTNPACEGLTGGSARVWRQTWMADDAAFYADDFEVTRDGAFVAATSIVCEPLE